MSPQAREHQRSNLASRPSELEVNRPPPIWMSPDGLLEGHPSDWPKANSNRVEDDPRTLAELAADVMKAAPEASTTDESSGPAEVSHGESTPAEQYAFAPAENAIRDDAAVADVPERPVGRSRNRRAALIAVVIILLFAAAGGFLWFDPSIGRSGADSGVDRTSATTTDGAAANVAGGTPSKNESSPVAAKEPAPAPTPASAIEHTPIPPADSGSLDGPIPEPSAEPTATPAPVPISTVTPAPRGVHVADLTASSKEIGKRVKVSVEIHVHDSAHNPVAGATVSGQWSDDIGSASCVTAGTGSCVAQTGPLAPPGSVTFTVTGIANAGEPYEPTMNHDLDGNTNGTSVTVTS
jgi:hypothetical protein